MKFYTSVTIASGPARTLAEVTLTGEVVESDGILSHVEVILSWAAPGYERVPVWLHVRDLCDAETSRVPHWVLKSELRKLIPATG